MQELMYRTTPQIISTEKANDIDADDYFDLNDSAFKLAFGAVDYNTQAVLQD
jgi:hypothetical protein